MVFLAKWIGISLFLMDWVIFTIKFKIGEIFGVTSLICFLFVYCNRKQGKVAEEYPKKTEGEDNERGETKEQNDSDYKKFVDEE